MDLGERKIEKPGEWRTWEKKYQEAKKEAEAWKNKILELEWEPQHIWRSIWRYWFGGVDPLHRVHFGRLITRFEGEKFSESVKLASVFFFKGWLAIHSNYRKGKYLIYTIKVKKHDFHALRINFKPFKIETFSYDENTPSCG